MFDLGFSKLLVIGLVALVVLGPERLPRVAKQAGQWLAKMRRYVDDVKSDFAKQADLDELRKLQTEVTSAAQTLKDSVQSTVDQTQSEFDTLNSSFSSTVSNEGVTDWDRIYAQRRAREKFKDRRKDRQKELGLTRPRFKR